MVRNPLTQSESQFLIVGSETLFQTVRVERYRLADYPDAAQRRDGGPIHINLQRPAIADGHKLTWHIGDPVNVTCSKQAAQDTLIIGVSYLEPAISTQLQDDPGIVAAAAQGPVVRRRYGRGRRG